MIILLLISLISAFSGCVKNNNSEKTAVMKAVIAEINGDTALVTPVEGSAELQSSDSFCISVTDAPSDLNAGDTVEITYGGNITETYPAGLDGISEIRIVEKYQKPGSTSPDPENRQSGSESSPAEHSNTANNERSESISPGADPDDHGTEMPPVSGNNDNTGPDDPRDISTRSAGGPWKLSVLSENGTVSGRSLVVSYDDSRVIEGFIASCKWEEGTADCLNDYMFIRENGNIIYYHSDCGTFNDTELNRSYHVTDEMRDQINSIIREYITDDTDSNV